MEHIDTVVVGAGQSGLAAGYHLARQGLPFAILEAADHVGDAWRSRWDSLRLFTPGRFSSLPGSTGPVGPAGCATKDEFADYLAAYAERFALPVRRGVRVEQVVVRGDGFELATSAGPIAANHLIVAAGHTGLPHRPSFAGELDGGIAQLHSSDYRNPASSPEGTVLVVGAGTSGAEIALELAATRTVVLAGRPTPHIPDPIFRYAGRPYWLLIDRVLTTGTPPGRRVAAGFGRRGAPLIRVSMHRVEEAGVIRVPAVTGVSGGQPRTADGPLPPVDAVIWATGYRPDLRWLPPLEVDDVGIPHTDRGVVGGIPGLYFLGLPFQYALTSALIGGVGRDAAYVVDRIARDTAAPLPQRT